MLTCVFLHVDMWFFSMLHSQHACSKKSSCQHAHELLFAQDTVLCSYFAQREGATKGDEGRRNMSAEVFQGLDRFGWVPEGSTEVWLEREERMWQAQVQKKRHRVWQPEAKVWWEWWRGKVNWKSLESGKLGKVKKKRTYTRILTFA